MLLSNFRNFVADAASTVQDGAAKGISAAQQRIESAKQGSHMLGDPEAEARLLAKKAAADAVALDQLLMSKLQATMEAYEAAAQQLSAAAKTKATAEEQGGNDIDMSALAEEYAARCMDLRAKLHTLAAAPQAPSISQAEHDAIVFLTTRKARENLTSTVSNQAGLAAHNAAAGAGAVKGIVRKSTTSFQETLGFGSAPASPALSGAEAGTASSSSKEAPLAEPTIPLAEETMVESAEPLQKSNEKVPS
mmetsp:Transcript_21365/g.49676  ORF Transcript_21365/g.49676 Transcript_21365/m.49676 type:complete len:249 (-) Transcript_21365:210-956(-)